MQFSSSLISDFVGTLFVRSCCYEEYLCRWGGEPACLVLSVVSVILFMFYFCFLFLCYNRFALFVSFVCLLYCVSHHLQGRVHDSDPMGGHDSDSCVGPGYFFFFFHPSGFSFLFFSFLFFAHCLISFRSIYLLHCSSCSLSLYIPFVLFVRLFLWVRVRVRVRVTYWRRLYRTNGLLSRIKYRNRGI